MTDIVERLRDRSDHYIAQHAMDTMDAAAAEIERLSETIRAFGRGDIVPITDKDAEIEQLRAVMADALRIMELVPSAAQDHRPIEDVRKEMRALLAGAAEQPVTEKP